MAKPSRSLARTIVCDGLSGLTNPIPDTAASESIVIGADLIKAREHFPAAIRGYADYIVSRLYKAGATEVWFSAGDLAFPEPDLTIGGLVNIVRELTV